MHEQAILSNMRVETESYSRLLFETTTLALLKDVKKLPGKIDQTQAANRLFAQRFESLRDLTLSQETLKILDGLTDEIAVSFKNINQGLRQVGISPGFGAAFLRQAATAFTRISTKLDEIPEAELALIDARTQQTIAAAYQTLYVLIIASCIAVALALLGALRTGRAIANSIKTITQAMSRMAKGDLDVLILKDVRSDEIGLAARAMEASRTSLIRNQALEREREQLNQELEHKVELRTQQLAEQKERLAQALKKEHELNGLQRQFVSMVCHEFRTPLAIIDGNAQRIIKRHDTIPADRIAGALGKVRTSVTRLTELMESVLNASRLESGTIKLDLAPCSLAEMITEVANNYQEIIGNAA